MSLTSDTYLRNSYRVKARQLTGGPKKINEVCLWLVENGYPWLNGEVLSRNSPSDSTVKCRNGIWIEPDKGILHVRYVIEDECRKSHYYEAYAEHEDWILILDSGRVRTMRNYDFSRKFTKDDHVSISND